MLAQIQEPVRVVLGRGRRGGRWWWAASRRVSEGCPGLHRKMQSDALRGGAVSAAWSGWKRACGMRTIPGEQDWARNNEQIGRMRVGGDVDEVEEERVSTDSDARPTGRLDAAAAVAAAAAATAPSDEGFPPVLQA